MTRQEANRLIVQIISDEVEQFPDGRFHQILYNLSINRIIPEFKEGKMTGNMVNIDLHHEEPIKTLERMSKEKDNL